MTERIKRVGSGGERWEMEIGVRDLKSEVRSREAGIGKGKSGGGSRPQVTVLPPNGVGCYCRKGGWLPVIAYVVTVAIHTFVGGDISPVLAAQVFGRFLRGLK